MTNQTTHYEDLLKHNGPVAIILKQFLRPVEGEGEPIFPPTYPMPTYRGRVYTVGSESDYRVSVELPPFKPDGSIADKGQYSEEVAGYNIDEFKNGNNICEIDSPQSQAKPLERLFETVKSGNLVPQIRIRVGETQEINLLAAGHRAADAIVRFSSLVENFSHAFKEVQKGNHSDLAKLAPTSILFGVWDSRGTQVRLPRIIKSEIRATNVERLTKSAQFNPAANFVDLGAVDESLDEGEGDKNPLGAEGMKHVPAPRSAGGVVVRGDIKRVARINLVVLRNLRAFKEGKRDREESEKLQKYILGLALVALAHPPQLNLREGCLLCPARGEKGKVSIQIVNSGGEEKDLQIDPDSAETFAEASAKAFFGEKYEKKDYLRAVFETNVANKFLGLKPDDRKAIARNGPITADAIRRFEEKGKDPLKLVSEAVKQAKAQLPKKKPGKNAVPIVQPEAFSAVKEKLEGLLEDEQIDDSIKDFSSELQDLIAKDTDSHSTLKTMEAKIKEFNTKRKEQGASVNEIAPSSEAQA